jgi:hypothetical protein
MTPEIIPFVRDSDAGTASASESNPAFDRITPELLAAHGLLKHNRQLQPRNHGIARWIALAVLTGTLAALLFVSFLAR